MVNLKCTVNLELHNGYTFPRNSAQTNEDVMLACKMLTWPSKLPLEQIMQVTMEFSLIKAKITVSESICDSRKASVMVFASGGGSLWRRGRGSSTWRLRVREKALKMKPSHCGGASIRERAWAFLTGLVCSFALSVCADAPPFPTLPPPPRHPPPCTHRYPHLQSRCIAPKPHLRSPRSQTSVSVRLQCCPRYVANVMLNCYYVSNIFPPKFGPPTPRRTTH